MREVFADTRFWSGVINPADEGCECAVELYDLPGATPVVTTESVLIRVLNFFCGYTPRTKRVASAGVHRPMVSEEVETVPHTGSAFSAG